MRDGAVIEAGLVAGYVIAWVVRKARRAAGRLDSAADAVMDAGLDRLYEMVAIRLDGHPVLEELAYQAELAAEDDGEVSTLTHRHVEQAVTAAALDDEAFGHAVAQLAARLSHAASVAPSSNATVFSGKADAKADRGGIAFGQVMGNVHIAPGSSGPTPPGRSQR